MTGLDEFGVSTNTDKASRYVRPDGSTDDGHDFLRHYERHLSHLRDVETVVLDLGVGFPPDEFASAKMWRAYLPLSRVIAIDYRDDLVSPDDRITFIQMDLGQPRALAALVRNFEPDLIVEDASHTWSHQLLSLIYLLPSMRPGGIYIWEDIHTSAWDESDQFSGGALVSPVDVLSLLVQKKVLEWTPPLSREGIQYTGLTQFHAAHSGPPVAALEFLLNSVATLVDSIDVVRGSAIIRTKS